jgi:hypothetical protein
VPRETRRRPSRWQGRGGWCRRPWFLAALTLFTLPPACARSSSCTPQPLGAISVAITAITVVAIIECRRFQLLATPQTWGATPSLREDGHLCESGPARAELEPEPVGPGCWTVMLACSGSPEWPRRIAYVGRPVRIHPADVQIGAGLPVQCHGERQVVVGATVTNDPIALSSRRSPWGTGHRICQAPSI